MAKTITVKAAKDALNNLRKAKPANKKFDDDLEMSIKEAVFFMAPDLIQFTKRGFTSRELAAGLAADGIQIKPGTLNRYLNEYLVAKQGVDKSGATSKEAEADAEKAEAQTSESSGSASRPQGVNEAGVKPPSTPASKDAASRPEKQSTATPNGKEDGGFENPKPAMGNPNPGHTASGGKSDWSRLAECTASSK